MTFDRSNMINFLFPRRNSAAKRDRQVQGAWNMETGKFEIEVHNARIFDIAQSILSDHHARLLAQEILKSKPCSRDTR